jgi:ferric-dicitrate binding protein FerR (iron transport regulator)
MLRIAAVLLLPLIIGSFYLGRFGIPQKGIKNQQVVYNEVFAPAGTRSAITLADGSRVWLNSQSTLRYPDRFTRGKREVFLTGEAYFEVESDVFNPFIIYSRELMIKATGTRFNVLSDKEASCTEITLVSGQVDVLRTLERKAPHLLYQMKPEDHLEFDHNKRSIELEHGDTYKYIAWKDGKLIFRNEPLSDVIIEISRYYNVDIELRGEKLKEYRYRATFEDETFSEILKLLKLSSPVDYREIPRYPLEDGSFPKRKVIIFPREAGIK